MNRMNKNDLLDLINSLKIDKEEFWVLSSGALVIREIFSDAGDLDIAVTNKGLEQLKQNYSLTKKDNGWYIVTEKIECICDGEKSKLKYQPELVNGIYVQNIFEYLKYLYNSSRQKDKDRIKLVEDYINSLSQDNSKKI